LQTQMILNLKMLLKIVDVSSSTLSFKEKFNRE